MNGRLFHYLAHFPPGGLNQPDLEVKQFVVILIMPFIAYALVTKANHHDDGNLFLTGTGFIISALLGRLLFQKEIKKLTDSFSEKDLFLLTFSVLF